MVKRSAFVVPSQPVLRKQPPSGPQWIHEVKFDGWRAQLHKAGDEVAIFMRRVDYTARFPASRDSLLMNLAESAIIDAVAVVCDDDGKPDFKALMENATGALCAWCFDLMELNGQDMRSLPLLERRVQLRHLLAKADENGLRYSDEFRSPEAARGRAEREGLRASSKKRSYQPYRSGKNAGWIKVKAAAWREANRDRREMFERVRR